MALRLKAISHQCKDARPLEGDVNAFSNPDALDGQLQSGLCRDGVACMARSFPQADVAVGGTVLQ